MSRGAKPLYPDDSSVCRTLLLRHMKKIHHDWLISLIIRILSAIYEETLTI